MSFARRAYLSETPESASAQFGASNEKPVPKSASIETAGTAKSDTQLETAFRVWKSLRFTGTQLNHMNVRVAERITNAMHAVHGDTVPAFKLLLPDGIARPRGFVLALHGGGWFMTGKGTLKSMGDVATRWQNRGFVVCNADYRPGAASLEDAIRSWKALRNALGSDLPGVAAGKSAGGHLALMTAVNRDVDAVVGESAPTLLAKLGGGPNADPVLGLAKDFFGDMPGGLDAFSPASKNNAQAIKGVVLLAASAADDVVPATQMNHFVQARPQNTRAMLLEAGDTDFIHAGVSEKAFKEFVQAEDELASQLLRAR